MEIFSVNSDWKRSYVEISAPDFILRRLVEFSDLTVCLDKIDQANGKISNYQDPIIYRCSLQTRIYTKFDNLHTSMPNTTKVHTMCETLQLSLSDTQLPMFLRLLELAEAIYYGDVPTFSSVDPQTTSSAACQEDEPVTEGTGTQELCEESVGWASWAWSFVPPVLPSSQESDDSNNPNQDEPQESCAPSTPVFDISFYNKKATLVFKLSKSMKLSHKNFNSKVIFEPILELKMEGNALEILARGLLFLDVQFGISRTAIYAIGDCTCATNESSYQQDIPLLSAGSDDSKRNPRLDYLTGCLFDSSQHHGAISTYIFDYDKHCQKYKESWAVEKFGAVWINYLWIEETPNPETSGKETSGTDFKSIFVDEISYMKFWFHDLTLNYTSSMKHRLDRIILCASNHSYQPYAVKDEEIVDPTRPTPSQQQIDCFERFIPSKNIHLGFLRSRINVYPSTHCKAGNLSNASTGLERRFCLKLSAERLDFQSTGPMYPRKLIRLVSQLPQPSNNLVYHCQRHQNIKAMKFESRLVLLNKPFEDCIDPPIKDEKTLVLPLTAAYYRSVLLLPMYWSQRQFERYSVRMEILEGTFIFTLPQLMTVYSTTMSWTDDFEKQKLIGTSLVDDAFNTTSGQFSILDVSFNQFELKQSSTMCVNAAFGNLGSVCVTVITKDEESDDMLSATVFQAPVDTSLLNHRHLFTTSKSIDNCSSDFLCFTFQAPKGAKTLTDISSSDGEHSVLLFTMQGWALSADPMIMKCLHYKELVASTSHPLHALRSEGASTQLSTSTTEVNITSNADLKKLEEVKAKDLGDSSSSGSFDLHYLAILHNLSYNLSINVAVKSGCVFVPQKSLMTPAMGWQHSMPEQWRQLSYLQELPPSVVVCLPSITAKSSDVSLSAPIEDLPVPSSSGVSPSFPVTCAIENLSVYSHVQGGFPYLIEPASLVTTVSFNTQPLSSCASSGSQSPPTSLSLHISTVVDPTHCTISSTQIKLVLQLLTSWIDIIPLLLTRITVESAASKTAMLGNSCHSITSVTDEEATYNGVDTNSGSLYERAQTTSSTSTTSSSASQKSIKVVIKAPKLSLNMLLKEDGFKRHSLCAISEDISCNMDIYGEYAKVQLKIWSSELLHGYFDIRCEEFVAGPKHGLLLSSTQRFLNLQSCPVKLGTEVLNSRDVSQMMKDKPRDAFLNFTYTRASCQSLKQRLSLADSGDLLKEGQGTSGKLSGEMQGNRNYGVTAEPNHISELCVDLTQCDIICYMPVIADALEILLLDLAPAAKQLVSQVLSSSEVPHDKPKDASQAPTPWLHSRTLPLLHFTIGNFRLILPIDSQLDECHDVLVVGVHGVELTPQVDNPLPHLILDNQLYQQKIKKLNFHGSPVDNRQFQMDLHALGVFTGKWTQMKLEEKKSYYSSSENPAFEWNKIAQAEELKIAKLDPIVSPLNLKLQFAPAITYHKTTVCGHSAEVNVTSDVLLCLSDVHVNLMYLLSMELISFFKDILLSQQLEAAPASSTQKHSPKGKVSNKKAGMILDFVTMVTAVDVLLTARHISLSLIGDKGVNPIVRVTFTQPHTLLCTKPSSERLEISCYDMSISLGPSFVLNSKDNPLPHTGDFPESLLTSQLGLPDDKTGILPCLFTLKIKSILNKPEINIDIGRPVAISLSVETVESVRAALVSLIPDACRSRQNCAFSSQNPALQPESSTTKSSAKLDIQLLDTYPKFPINTLALTASKFKLSIEFRERQKVHFHMHHYSLTTSVMSSTDFDQLDIALRFAAVDIELIVSSPQLLNSRVLGPFSFTADVNSAISRIHVPFSNIRISSSVLPFQAGIENIEISTSCFAELSAIFVQKTELPPRSSGGNWISASVSNDPRRLSLDSSDYYDDLRMGAFKYLLEKERKLPVANTVLFYSDHDSSTLTWTYLQPRVISAIHINPIPFDYPVDPNAGFFLQDVQIGCSLEYWNLKSTSFTKYADFSISEQFGTSVSLPLVTSGLAVSSRTWRIVINYYLERNYCLDPVEDYVFAMVSPAVLVAAMKVDSKYAPSLVPILQVSLNVNQMRLNIASSHTLAAGHHEKLVHFDLKCEGDSYRQDIFSMLLDNTLLELGVWPCQLNNSLTSPSVKFQSSHSLTLRFCDLKHLVWKPMVALEDIKVDGSFATQGNQRCYALHVGIGKTEMTMSQDCINTILQLFSMFKQHTGGLQHLPLSYMYTMCNNTHVGLYVKQVSCDDNSAIHIPPGTAHPFCWNKYSPLQVQLSQDKGLHNWSSASALDDTGVHVTKIWNHVPFKDRDSNYVTLFIDVEKMTSVHKMVTISGSVCVTSRLSTTHLDIRLSTTEKHNFHMKIARSFSFSSFAISNGCGKELRVREVASKADDQHPYSQPIHLDHKAVAALDLFTVSLNRDMAEACCRVMVKHLEGESQYCVEFSPLYSIKSYLPHTLAVSVLPTASNWLIHTSCATELAGLASSEAYVLSLRPSESTSGTPVELPLSLNTFTSLEDVEEYDSRISVLDICRQSAISFRTSRNVWPDSSQNYKLDGKFQPLSIDIPQSVLTSELTLTDVCTENVGVEISWKQHWVGTASLLMTIKPQCVFVNNTSVNICIVYGSQFSPIQPRQTVISPNSLQTYFTIGIYGNEHMSTSDLIYLSEDDINPRSFVSANKCILFMESYAYTNIGVSQAQHRPHQLLYFVITSHKCDGVRVITVHERFIVHNSTKKDLFISALAAPICSSRVHPQEVTSHPVQLPCDTSMSLPLTTTQIIETASTAAVVFLTFSQVLGDWSYPFQLPIEQFAMRHSTLAVPLETSLDTKCLCLTLSTVNGVTYIVVGESLVPTIFLHNSCALPLAYGQTLTNRSEEVLEAMSLLSQPPVIKSMHSTAYTFTTVNKQYPLHVGCTEYPRLKIASVGGQYGVEVWSEGINIFDSNLMQLLHVPDFGEIKVTIKSCQLNQHVYIEPIDRVKDAVCEVRGEDGSILSVTGSINSIETFSGVENGADEGQQQVTAGNTLSGMSISANILLEEMVFVLVDSQHCVGDSREFLQLHLSGAGACLHHSTTPNRNEVKDVTLQLLLLDLNLYNQQLSTGLYDFHHILASQKPSSLSSSNPLFGDQLKFIQEKRAMKVDLSFECGLEGEGYKLVTVGVACQPLCVRIEDSLVQSLVKTIDSYLTMASLLPATSDNCAQNNWLLPKNVLTHANRYSTVLTLRKFQVEKCELLISVHASLKVFVATDNAPLTLSRFSRTYIVTTFAQLLADLGYHYGTGALYCAGWLVGSLELLFNPTGIVRSVMAGLSDMIYLPYYGFQQSPAAFVTGVSQGMTSVVKHVTHGTLSSVTQFAQSVSRNMDRLSLDNKFSERQKLKRQNTPEALSQGLRQGFDGLALSFLGAVAGLADEPLQGFLAEDLSVQHRAVAVVTGVGKGILGAFTKPISGTAEFISQAGHGLMGSFGLTSQKYVSPQYVSSLPAECTVYDFSLSKYTLGLTMLAPHSGPVLCAVRVFSPLTSSGILNLLLFKNLLLVLECKEMELQQSFALSEINCVKHELESSVYLRIYLAGKQSFSKETNISSSHQLRVRDYVCSTSSSGYSSLTDPQSGTSAASISSGSLLHEYCVLAQDIDYFLAMFRYAQRVLRWNQ